MKTRRELCGQKALWLYGQCLQLLHARLAMVSEPLVPVKSRLVWPLSADLGGRGPFRHKAGARLSSRAGSCAVGPWR